MEKTALYKGTYMPTLRLSIIDSCNGICPFCHKEGLEDYCSNQYLNLESVYNQIIPAIISVGIKKVILTGGEPTLHSQLSGIAKSIKEQCPDVHLGMTTNGLHTERISETVRYLDRITVSLSSFRPEVYLKYTKVNPENLLSFINSINPKSKAASLVITEDNYSEIIELVSCLVKQSYDVKLQFVINNIDISQKRKYQLYRRICDEFGDSKIVLSATPALCWRASTGSTIRLKLDSLSQFVYDHLVHRKICNTCSSRDVCVERGCAVRVYPNGNATPCLNNHIVYNNSQIKDNIVKAYDAIELI